MKSLLFSLALSIIPNLASANVVGADTQNFNPTNDGLDFVTVQSSETLEPGLFNLGVFLNYAVNSLPNYEDTITQKRTNFRDSLLSSDLNFAYGIRPGWEAGLSFPAVLRQTVTSDDDTFRGQYASTGLTEIRAMTKVRFLGDTDHGVGAVASVNFNQIANNPFLGSKAGPTLNLELVGDTTIDKFALGANIGYRFRHPGLPLPDVPIQPLGNQFIASAAVSYLVTDWDTKVIGELFGSVPTKKSEYISDRGESSLEALLGIKHDFSRSLAFHFGGGTEVIHGTASPDWRVYTGLNWVIGPFFQRHEEVIVRKSDPTADPFAGKPEMVEEFTARDVLFDFNKDTLQASAIESLKHMAEYLRKPPMFKSVTVEGHTDSVGNSAYNLSLSQRRADHVRLTLIQAGLPASKVHAIGYGASRPIADNGNFQGRAQNRRVEFKVLR